MDNFENFVPNVTFEKIPIKNLVSNQDYQRNLSRSHIQKAAENFDLYQINPVKVSRRDGVNFVFNGQHTIEIVALVSGSRDTPVWCMIYDDLSYQHEADIFANQMKYVKNLNPYEVFMANIEAGNDDQLMIRDIVESYGMSIASTKYPGTICAVATLESIYKKYGYHVLDRTLRIVIGTWEGDRNSFSANIMNAIAKIIVVFGDALNEELFKEKVGAMSVKQLIRTAKERRPGSMGFAEAMVIAYNGKKKSAGNKLRLNKLYSKEAALYNPSDEPIDTDTDDGDDDDFYDDED